MFSRFFNTEIDEREAFKKAIALLKPQTDRLHAEADANRVRKQQELQPQLDALIQQREAEVPRLQTAMKP